MFKEKPGCCCCCCCCVASVVSNSVWPHRQQPTRLLCPWDSPGKNTGVGCHFLLQCMKVESESEVAQLCPTLSDPMDCSLPGSSDHGIFQARVLEWGAIAFSEKPGTDTEKGTEALNDNVWSVCVCMCLLWIPFFKWNLTQKSKKLVRPSVSRQWRRCPHATPLALRHSTRTLKYSLKSHWIGWLLRGQLDSVNLEQNSELRLPWMTLSLTQNS